MNLKETYIYKYCSLEAGQAIVGTQHLKFNNPSFFNDPFDCDIDLLEFNFSDCCEEVLVDIEKAKKIAFARLSRTPQHILEKTYNETMSKSFIEENHKKSAINKIKKSRICCFSSKYDEMTMWSHYADKHRGVCLIFDLRELDRFVDGEINRRMSSGIVEYKDLVSVNYLKDKKIGVDNLYLTKSKDWAYENEIRLFILEKDLQYIKFKKPFLKGVIFGVNVTDEEIERFKLTFDHGGFPHFIFARVVKRNLRLALDIEPE